jgi:hypothetical protein
VLRFQGSVRAVIAATITRPELAPARPGFRFGLIDHALDPVVGAPDQVSAPRVIQLKQDLAAIISAEALFSLTDLCGLDSDRAIGSLRRTARAITDVAMSEIEPDPAAGARRRR